MLPASVRYLAIVSGCCCAFSFGQSVAADDVHPLQAALELCESSHREMVRTIADYEATLVKRERLNGQLRDQEVMRIKVRHENKSAAGKEIPFSVHIQFRHPESAKGREVAYVAGRNRGQLIVREGRQGLIGRDRTDVDAESAGPTGNARESVSRHGDWVRGVTAPSDGSRARRNETGQLPGSVPQRRPK